MDAARGYHAKGTKSERGQMPYDITYMWNLKYGTNELIHRNRNRVIKNRLVVAKGDGGGREMDCEFGVGRCKLLRVE